MSVALRYPAAALNDGECCVGISRRYFLGVEELEEALDVEAMESVDLTRRKERRKKGKGLVKCVVEVLEVAVVIVVGERGSEIKRGKRG
jgi:hypothetical protein